MGYNNVSGPWDAGQYPRTNSQQNQANVDVVVNSNYFYGVVCENVITSITDVTIIKIVVPGATAEINVSMIVSVEITGSLLTIRTQDTIPYYLYCNTIVDATKINTRIYNILNSGTDSGC